LDKEVKMKYISTVKMKSTDLIKYYDNNYFLNKVEGHQDFKNGKCGLRKLDSIKDVDFKNKTVLDVGYGRGEILEEAIKRGASKCIGVDFSLDAYNIAREYCNNKILLFCKNFINIDKIDYKYNLVFMLDILEHVNNDEAIEFINKLKCKLKKNAILIATTPINAKAGDFKGMHINQYSVKKLKAYFGLAFFNIKIDFRQKGHYYIKCEGVT